MPKQNKYSVLFCPA